jgi:hypothetical protein
LQNQPSARGFDPIPNGQKQETHMTGTIISFIIQLIGGAVGGKAAGGLLININLGRLGNTIAGGGIGGSILSGLIPALGSAASGAGGFDIGARPGKWLAAASPARSSRQPWASSRMPFSTKPDKTAGRTNSLPSLGS